MRSSSASLHSLHPYPCKFPESVVLEALSGGRRVLDPYCGSGTTLLEAAIRGHDVIGIDCNPIALLISRAKLLSIDQINTFEVSALIERLRNAKTSPHGADADLPDFHGRDHWFSKVARQEFGLIRNELDTLEREGPAWTALATVASSLVTRFSNQDSETRYARVERSIPSGRILSAFIDKFAQYQQWIFDRGELSGAHELHLSDFGSENVIESLSVDQVITSPPYANTMDYYLYHKQRMNFLGYNFKIAQASEIGSRHEYSSQKQTPDQWDLDLKSGLSEVYRVLKQGAHAVYVIGDSQIAKKRIDASSVIERLAKEVGFEFKLLKSVAMSGKSRLFSQAFQAPNKFEHTIQLTKR